jgi:hypothetical protein
MLSRLGRPPDELTQYIEFAVIDQYNFNLNVVFICKF